MDFGVLVAAGAGVDEDPLPAGALGASVPTFGVSRSCTGAGADEDEDEDEDVPLRELSRVPLSSLSLVRLRLVALPSDESPRDEGRSPLRRSLDEVPLRVPLSDVPDPLSDAPPLAGVAGGGRFVAPGAGTPGAPPRPGRPPSGDGRAPAGVPPVTGAIGLASRAKVVSIAPGARATPA